ncbi:hypothetical protein [Kaistella pullorum]|uniref:Uncharacterized protein n=1 Tax=Kaistella pullorum TaxID=2763074 RepID=A0ABR8WLT6_9FLAO|nr:hypothetical protein [Kaistella pullorum]MBD8018040.1 hypothetical protein [Kaistella pullorum]
MFYNNTAIFFKIRHQFYELLVIFYKLTVTKLAVHLVAVLHLSKIKRMKKFALIAAVVFTTYTLESCRQPDEALSPTEAATLKRVQDSTSKLDDSHNVQGTNTDPAGTSNLEVDGEIVIPPKK